MVKEKEKETEIHGVVRTLIREEQTGTLIDQQGKGDNKVHSYS